MAKVGILSAVDSAVRKPNPTAGYSALVGEGMQDMPFEAVVLRHPQVFSAAALAKSKERMAQWQPEVNTPRGCRCREPEQGLDHCRSARRQSRVALMTRCVPAH